MPVWLTLLGGVLATVGFLGAIFGLVMVLIQGKAAQGGPRFGLFSTGGNGSLGAFVTWDPATFDVKFYRFKFNLCMPGRAESETQFSFTFDNPRAESFSEVLTLPPPLIALLADPKAKAIISIEARSTEEYAIIKNLTVKGFRKFYQGGKQRPAGIAASEAPLHVDPPVTQTLDHSELVERKKKVKALEAEANAKAAKKPAPVAAKPTPAPTPA